MTLHSAQAPARLPRFRHRPGDQLIEGEKPFRFISFNIPNLHLVEDNMAFDDENPWRWPDRFEITDALDSVRQQGGTVVRTYVLSVLRTNDPPGVPRHVLGPGRFNEEAFRALDLVLQIANETGVRVIIPFVDNWSWWGGIAEYAGFRGKPKEAFWTDPQVIADFKETIRFLVNRTNTLTGVPYRDDKAILCWETGNELQSPPAWTREIAAYIKSLDHEPSRHGRLPHAPSSARNRWPCPRWISSPPTITPAARNPSPNWSAPTGRRRKGRKPYVVGEFGFVDTAPDGGHASTPSCRPAPPGALVWSLRSTQP